MQALANVQVNRDSIRRMLKKGDKGASAWVKKGKSTKCLTSMYGDVVEKVETATMRSIRKLRKA